MKTLKRTWADVSMDDLEHNYNAIMGHVPSGCRFLGVIKADAYGHGAVPVSQALTDLGAAYLAVSNLEEAIQIRRAGIRTPILILGYTPPEYADSMVFMDITQEVHSLEYAEALETALSGTNYILNVHLKLDTGMTRIGFFAYGAPQTAEQLLAVCRMRHLRVEGAFTHFSVADSKAPDDVTYTKAQFARFTAMLAELSAAGVQIELRHCCSSGATILYPEFALDMVRPGIATYGLAPSADAAGVLDLRPIMSLHTSVAQIRDVPAGTDVSYGRTYTTEKPTRMAVLPIGYADGLSRALSGKAAFRIHGKDAPVIGRICMDMCMVDVSGIDGVSVGDTATLFGYDETGALIPCERVSDALGTIPYEVLCFVNKRIPRFYTENGRPSQILQYIV